jgi:hypothetical protein
LQGLDLGAFFYLALALGDPWTFQTGKEPRPRDVIDLVWEHVHQDSAL